MKYIIFYTTKRLKNEGNRRLKKPVIRTEIEHRKYTHFYPYMSQDFQLLISNPLQNRNLKPLETQMIKGVRGIGGGIKIKVVYY